MPRACALIVPLNFLCLYPQASLSTGKALRTPAGSNRLQHIKPPPLHLPPISHGYAFTQALIVAPRLSYVVCILCLV